MASLALAGVVVARSRRWQDALPILVAGVLVDVDHLVDIGVLRARGQHDRIVLPLHAWEFVFALLARRSHMADGLAGGLATHLAMDQTNPAIRHPFFYWLWVRVMYRFRASEPLVYTEVFQASGEWVNKGPASWI
jgi:hypothetical protein